MNPPSLTPVLIQEMTEDAVQAIWAEAQEWYVTRALYSSGKEPDEEESFYRSCRLKPFTQRIPIKGIAHPFAVWAMDTMLYVAILWVVLSFIPMSTQLREVLIGTFWMPSICMMAMHEAMFNTRAVKKSKPLGMTHRIMYHLKKKALYRHNYTPSEKLNICADFLQYYGHATIFDTEESQRANVRKRNNRLNEIYKMHKSLTTFSAENQSALQITNATVHDEEKNVMTQFEIASEHNNKVLATANKQMALADAFYAFSDIMSLAERSPFKTEPLDALMNDDILSEAHQSIEKMSNVLKGATDEIDFKRQNA